MDGFIKLPRALLEGPILNSADALRVCVWLYANADENGQIQFSSGDAMRLFRITPRQFRTIVSLLKETNTATIKTTNKTTSIMLCHLGNCNAVLKPKRQAERQAARLTTTSKTSSDTLTFQPKYPFVDPMFEEAFLTWLDYKEKQWKFKYKTERSLKSAYAELVGLSGSDPCKAMRIVEQSMSNGWKGLFELKEQYGTAKQSNFASGRYTSGTRSRLAGLKEAAGAILQQPGNLDAYFNDKG